MFTRPLYNSDPSRAASAVDTAAPQYQLGNYSYGKRWIRVFELNKKNIKHEILDYKVSIRARLKTFKEYYDGDNADVIGSDVLETNVYLHAQQYGLRTPEEFALTITQHFLDTYDLLAESNVIVENMSWDPLGVLEKDGSYKNKSHNHVFMRDTNCTRYCEVVRKRNEQPLLIGGLSGLRLIKTAKAPFKGYVKDNNLFYEGDLSDRILCVEIDARWQYKHVEDIDFSNSWSKVRDIILRTFAGDSVDGVVMTSVQYASYQAERAVLDAVPEICSVSITLLNIPHLPYDFSRFDTLESKPHQVISCPKETPVSFGFAHSDRINH